MASNVAGHRARSRPASTAVRTCDPVSDPTNGEPDARFLWGLYSGSLALRLLVGIGIYLSGYLYLFAGDAWTYDHWGWGLAQYWRGELQNPRWVLERVASTGRNGMYYWVAALYYVFGRSQLLATILQIFIVSATPVVVYKIARRIYGSIAVARVASLLAAGLPSMVVWSCTLLKDPIVVLLLSLSVLYTLKLQQELKLRYVIPALLSTLLIFPLRGYVFYFMLFALVGSLMLARFGGRTSRARYLVRVAAIVVVAAAFFVFGFDRIAGQQLSERMLENLQSSRLDLAERAETGYMPAARVDTLRGALEFLPTGVAYLLFAPFPWERGGIRVQLAMPEMLAWYALFPFSVAGLLHTLLRRLRVATVVLLFVVQLTAFYGVFIGNAGTAHRQRTQVFVFYLMFTAVGLVQARAALRARRDSAGG